MPLAMIQRNIYESDERWLSHKCYVSYMIMQSNMKMNAQVKRKRWKLHGNISRNVTGFGCTGEVCTDSRGEKGQCTVPQRLANCEKVSVGIIHGLTLVIRTHILIAKVYQPSKQSTTTHAPRGIDWQEKTIARPRPPLIRRTISNKSCSNIIA